MRQEEIAALTRSVIAFFAAVVGFGLKRLLDLTVTPTASELAPYGWWCFATVGLLAVRLLTGSSAHLTREYRQRAARAVQAGMLVLDILSLLGFGLLLVLMAYAPTIRDFLTRGTWVGLAGLGWSSLVWACRQKELQTWWFFLLINLAVTLTFAVPGWLHPGPALPAATLKIVLWISLVIAALDLFLQVKAMGA